MIAFLPRRRCAVLLAAAWIAAGPAAAEPLTFQQALSIAERSAPENLAQTAQLDAARAAVIPADALPDPKLSLGVDNLPLEGPDRYRLDRDFMTMRRIGLMQEVPNGDKRHARRQLAEAGVVRSEAEQVAMRLETRRQTAVAWLEVFHLERSLQVLSELDREIARLRGLVQAQIAGGGARSGDLLLADRDALALEERRDELERDRQQARAGLRRWLGDAADAPLAGEPPRFALDSQRLHQHLLDHPELQTASARIGEAQAELAEALAEKKPDWDVEVAYSNRDSRFGDMLSLQFSFDLPLFTGTRQGPRIDARQKGLVQREAEQEALQRAHRAELESGLASLDQLSRALERSERSLVPLARQRADLELAAYRAGTGELPAVIEARRELIEARLRQIELAKKRDQLAASLHYAYSENRP